MFSEGTTTHVPIGLSPPGAKGVTPNSARHCAYSATGVFTSRREPQTITNADFPSMKPRPPKTFFCLMPSLTDLRKSVFDACD